MEDERYNEERKLENGFSNAEAADAYEDGASGEGKSTGVTHGFSADGTEVVPENGADSTTSVQPTEPFTSHYSYPAGEPVRVRPDSAPQSSAQDARRLESASHTYSTSHLSGAGEVSYKAERKEKQTHSRGISRGASVLLVIVCIVSSLCFGALGAFFAGEGNGSEVAGGAVNPTVIYRSVDSVSTSSDGSELSYADVEALTGDSVVAITTEYQSMGLWSYVTSGAGSGVVMSADGYIITNNHVVAGSSSSRYADKITVVLKNGEEYEAEIVGGDAGSDIAVIKIKPESELTSAVFADSDKLAVGEEVVAIGNPLGTLSGTTTNGIISALAREIEVDGVDMKLLQTNAAINPGNSGGGLFNMNGELIGIVNAKSSGTGIEGLGFAIPSNDALDKATQLIERGEVTSNAKSKIGITTVDIFTREMAQKYGVNTYGVYVAALEEGYNEDVLRVGDRLLAINEAEITAGSDVVNTVAESEPGTVLKFILYRNGRMLTVDVTCYEREADTEQDIEF